MERNFPTFKCRIDGAGDGAFIWVTFPAGFTEPSRPRDSVLIRLTNASGRLTFNGTVKVTRKRKHTQFWVKTSTFAPNSLSLKRCFRRKWHTGFTDNTGSTAINAVGARRIKTNDSRKKPRADNAFQLSAAHTKPSITIELTPATGTRGFRRNLI